MTVKNPRLAGIAVALVAVLALAPLERDVDAAGPCAKTYTRAHFHSAARSTFRHAFPPAGKKATLARVVRCQRRPQSGRLVRFHLRRYTAEWRERFRWERAWASVPGWLKARLAAIAGCESGGNPSAVSSSGLYRGLLQFDYGTWASVGGHGDPATAPALEQLVRGATLYQRRGAAPWPVCGR